MIYQLKIELQYSSPLIWRRVLVKADTVLPDLHSIIQTTMGWDNGHMHQFVKGRKFYAPKQEEDSFFGVDKSNINYEKVKISEVLAKEKSKIIYEYDFGDSWTHDVILEKILQVDTTVIYPVCTAGKMACPMEDCGGIGGHEQHLEILKDPTHEEYADVLDWYGGHYVEEEFNIEEVNELLQQDNYGCVSLF